MAPKINTGNESYIYLTLEQIREIISSIPNARDKLMLRILYETGCTPAELINICVSDVSGNTIKIRNNETKELRFPKISGRLAKDISLFVQGNKLPKTDFILSTRQSKKISEKRIRQLIQEYTITSIKQPLNPLMFRYFHIAHAYLNGVFIEDIAEQLGLTKFRIFQILQLFDLKPRQNHYNNFLVRVG